MSRLFWYYLSRHVFLWTTLPPWETEGTNAFALRSFSETRIISRAWSSLAVAAAMNVPGDLFALLQELPNELRCAIHDAPQFIQGNPVVLIVNHYILWYLVSKLKNMRAPVIDRYFCYVQCIFRFPQLYLGSFKFRRSFRREDAREHYRACFSCFLFGFMRLLILASKKVVVFSQTMYLSFTFHLMRFFRKRLKVQETWTFCWLLTFSKHCNYI